MAGKFVAIGDGIWARDGEVRMGPGMVFPSRCCALRQSDGSLLLWSPLALEPEDEDQLESLGGVSAVVAPNTYHHLFLARAQARWPDAKLWAAPGVEIKQPGLKIHRTLSDSVDVDPAVGTRLVGGLPKLNEVAVVHRPSRTLLVADMLFNVDQAAWVAKLLLKMSGAHGRLTQSRFWRSLVKDPDAEAQAYGEILTWDFDRLVMAHGNVVSAGAKDRVAAILNRD